MAVKQPSSTPGEVVPSHRLSNPQVSLSASLKERKERQKEVLSKNPQKLAKTLTYGN